MKKKKIRYATMIKTIDMKLFLLLIFFSSIIPSLGFFTLTSFLIVTIVFCVFLFVRRLNNAVSVFPLVLLIVYGIVFYGGLYQNNSSFFAGRFLSFVMLIVSLLPVIFPKTPGAYSKMLFALIIAFYLFLGSWTIYNSPHPRVDTFYQFLEAPQKILLGENPYASTFTKVYAGVKPDYFPYLPFSFLYTLPFVFLFSDPRFGIILANSVSAYIIYRLFQSKQKEQIGLLFVSAFLLLPRSFYIIEHMYLDPIIFMFYLLFLYFYLKKSHSLSTISLSLFFLFKQHLIILLPFIFQKKRIRPVLFFFPFLVIALFFLLDRTAFMRNIVFYFNPKTVPAPIHMSLSFTTFLSALPSLETSNLPYLISLFLFIGIYLYIIRSGRSFIFKTTISIFAFTYFMYQSFYNHYYMVAQFLFLDILLEYLRINV